MDDIRMLRNRVFVVEVENVKLEAENARLREALSQIENYQFDYDLDNIPECDLKYSQFGERMKVTHIPTGCVGGGENKEQAVDVLRDILGGMWLPDAKKKYRREIAPLVEIARKAKGEVDGK